MLIGFCKERKMDRTVEYLEIMVSRDCYPDIVTYNTLLTALCKDGKVDVAIEILNQLNTKASSPVLITCNTSNRTEHPSTVNEELNLLSLEIHYVIYPPRKRKRMQ